MVKSLKIHFIFGNSVKTTNKSRTNCELPQNMQKYIDRSSRVVYNMFHKLSYAINFLSIWATAEVN